MTSALPLPRGLEGRFYADSAIFAAERERIFRSAWQLVGHDSAFGAAGSTRPIDIAGASVFVVRGEDGALRAFRNVCRHRGASLVAEDRPAGCAPIACPSHGWRYGLDGQLLQTPWFGEESPFDLPALSLIPVEIGLWRALVFVALEPREPLLEQLGEMPAYFADIPLERMIEYDRATFVEAFNWKAYIDQFTDYYHSPAVHGSDERVGIDRFTADPIRRGMIMRAPDSLAFYGAQWVWTWPNLTIATFEGGVKISRIVPLTAGTSEVRFLFLADPLAAVELSALQRIVDATLGIFAEDAALLRQLQRNLESGSFEEPGPLHPRHERATAYFQQLVREALA